MSRKEVAVRAQAATPFDALTTQLQGVAEQILEATEVVEQKLEEPLTAHDELIQPDLSNEKTIMALGESYLIGYYGSKSKAIRGLSALGHKCGPISRALNILYQHARNVLNKPLKRLIKEERDAAKLGTDIEELEGDE